MKTSNKTSNKTDIQPTHDISEYSTFNIAKEYKSGMDEIVSAAAVDEDSSSTQLPTNVDELDKMFEDDFKLARKNIMKIAKTSEGILNEMIQLARASDHPRAYEVVGQLISKLTDVNKDLIGIYEKRQAIKRNDESSKPAAAGHSLSSANGSNVTNNAVFVGSTSELQEFMKNRNV